MIHTCELIKCILILNFYRGKNIDFFLLVLGILHGVRGEFPDDVSGAAVGPIFTGHESESK
jgi:hypothetical protein